MIAFLIYCFCRASHYEVFFILGEVNAGFLLGIVVLLN
jgi:hypothetical protein